MVHIKTVQAKFCTMQKGITQDLGLAYAGLAPTVLESTLQQSLAHAGLGLDSLGKYLQAKSCTRRTWTRQSCVSQ